MNVLDSIEFRRWRSLLFSFAVAALLLAHAPAALAWFQPSAPGTDPNFEIDVPANALDESAYAGDDWETVYKCKQGGIGYNATDCAALGGFNANFVNTTGILPDPSPQSIFWKGGSKDTNDVSQWWWKDGSVPDKDQILHGGAVAYQANDADGEQLIMYLFADRYANDGDALMGAWFFQNEVAPDPDHPGQFIGVHKNGDIVWFGNFTGGGVVSSLEIAKWNDPGLPGYDATCAQNSDPNVPYQVGNTKLCVVAKGQGGAGSGYFASVNTGDEQSPWPYTPKQGTDGYFPYNSFFEGGINITKLLGSTPCFSSFLIESRSSTSETAQLKDFVLGSINTCKIAVDKRCDSALASNGASINDTFGIYIKNEGFAAITGVTLDDTNPPTAQDLTVSGLNITNDGNWHLVHQYTINTTTQNESNTVTAIGHAGTADTAPATDTVTCPTVPTSAQLTVTKNCNKTQLTVDTRGTASTADDRLNVEVFYSGSVCNNNAAADAVKLFNVQATEVHNGLSPAALSLTFPGTTGQLAVGECATFSGSYFPNAVSGSNITAQNPVACTGANPNWTDTVDATATSPLVSGTVDGIADNATCPLVCPYP